MGGTLAYEIACQLQYQGKTIQYIFMFDSWADFSNEFRKKEVFLKDMQRQQREYYNSLTEINADTSDKNNLVEAQWGLMQLLLSYTPQVNNNLPIILFKATDLNEIHATNEPSENNRWLEYCTNVEVYHIPGDHVTIMINEGLLKICEIMVNKLELAKLDNYQKVLY